MGVSAYGEPSDGDTGCVLQRVWVDFIPQQWVNGCLAVLACQDDQGVLVVAFGLQFGDDLAEGRVHKIQSLQDAGADGRVVVVLGRLLRHRDTLVVAAEDGRHAGDFRPGRGDGRVNWRDAVDPIQPRVHVELVVCDRCVDGVGCGDLLGKVALGQACSAGSADEVVHGMFVGVGCLETCCSGHFEDRVDAEAHVWVHLCAFAIHDGHGEVGRVDAAGKEERVVVVNRLVVEDW